jgi:hypothetical protein
MPNTSPAAACPVCDAPLGEHIGGKPCVQSPPSTARHLHDLPIFGWAWGEDGRDRQA